MKKEQKEQRKQKDIGGQNSFKPFRVASLLQ